MQKDIKPTLQTQAIWSGESKPFANNASITPIYNAVTFAYDSVEQWQAVGSGEQPGYLYSRSSNPTVALFEQKMQILEGAQAATAFASGMAAISNTLMALLTPGDKVISITDCYGGTAKLFSHYLPRLNIVVETYPSDCQDELIEAIGKGCKLVYLETPTNPLLKLLDIKLISQACIKANAILVVDNTLASPINQKPLELGADIVVHSATKYISGHSDVIGGIACGAKTLIDTIYAYRDITGACLDPNAAYQLIRGLKTLPLRVTQHNENALKLSQFLLQHPKVATVNYPGLIEHPHHQLAKSQMSGYGGLFSFTLKTEDFDQVKTFLNNLNFAHLAASLGSVDTLIGPPSVTSHAEFDREQREQMGIFDNLIRCAAGIEDADDLIQDFEQALALLPND